MGKKRERVKKAIEQEKTTNAISDIGIGGGINPVGFPFNQGTGWSSPVSQPFAIYENLRWYLVSNNRNLLNEMYAEIGLVQTVVDVPVDDALRGGITITSKQLSQKQVELIQAKMEEKDDLNIIGQATKWNRLFGGAGVLPFTDQDPSTPLVISEIDKSSNLEFHAVDMWELFYDKQSTEGALVPYERDNFEYYNYYGMQLHRSRVLRQVGITAPSMLRPKLRGWGLSVIETLVSSLDQYVKSRSLIFEVLDEFKVDVYKIKNLVNTLMSPLGEAKVQERVQRANALKNFQNAIVMDSEDDWDHKQLSFAGIAEAMSEIRMQVASDLRMPLTKIFGISSAGFNSGEDDIEVYNGMVQSQVRNKMKYIVLFAVQLRCQEMFGFVPDDLRIDFKPLREMSSEQQENVKTQQFNRLIQSKTAGEISTEEFREGCNEGKLLGVVLDTSNLALEEDSDQDDNVSELEYEDDGDGGDESGGANKLQSQRSITSKTANSIEFDLASYKAEGGDSWVDPRRKYFFENPVGADPSLWEKAVERSKEAFDGEVKWQFVLFIYKKLGGQGV